MKYRHELKFLVSDRESEMIRHRLKPLLRQDVHQALGKYRVRSLYFDDYQDSCMKENEDGIDNRHKFRIRTYNSDDSVIKLEKKKKCKGMSLKESCFLSRESCLDYMKGMTGCLRNGGSRLEKELYVEIKTKGMHPVSIVEYERTAYVEPRGNVRVTFDKNLGADSRTEHFLEGKLQTVPLLQKGMHVLEVKYDELLPSYIYEALNIGTLQSCSFSKYYYSRIINTF